MADFLRFLTRSRLVASDRLDQWLSQAPGQATQHSPTLAEYLIRVGVLNRFQADKLLRGFWQGLVIGPYRLLCPLGRGGMGIVYLARDDKLSLVALKVLPPQRARQEPRTLIRFEREKDIGRAMPPHPQLARTIGAGEEGEVHYLAMEYVPGPTVRQSVSEGGPMSVGAACRVFADAAAGLYAAHQAGFVHRDFKPSNLIVTPTGRGKVLDFGFALRVGEPAEADPMILGGQGYTLGTMDYLPPEQAADAASVGPSADVYALGCSLYFALAGCPPFPGGGAQEKIRWHRTAAPPPVTQINPTLPAELDRMVRWFMAKSPADRPTADAVARELSRWADPMRPLASGAEPSDAQLIRAAEAKWIAITMAGTAVVDDEPVVNPDTGPQLPLPPADDDEASGVEIVEVVPAVRVPVGVWVLVGCGLLGFVAFFVFGLVLGLALSGG